MAGSLSGIRVLELGRFLAGPYTGLLLADLGAEVIRVEPSTGAEDRAIGLLSPSGDCYAFVNTNRNKKGISLNFTKNAKAREILNDLAKLCDVVIENFSPEAAKAMGITYDNFKKIKPDIIFAEITAFGPNGPYSHRLGFDQVGKAMSGAMSISGFPGGPPMREQVAWVDFGTASLTAVGILAALYHRRITGQGQTIDTSLLRTSVSYTSVFISEWETGKRLREQIGNRAYWAGPVDLYKTKDGRWVILGVYTNSIWRRFCRFIGREDLASDPRFDSEWARWEHRDILDPVVNQWASSLTAEEIFAAAEKMPIPVGICSKLTEVAHNPQVKNQEMLKWVPFPDGEVLVSGTPLKMSGTPLEIQRSFPAIGEHNEEIYCGLLGYSSKDLIRFKKEEVI